MLDSSRSTQILKYAAIVLSALGFIDSIYLIVIKYANNKALCFIGAGECLSVNSSIYSEIFGFPIAGIGAAGYLAILALFVFNQRLPFISRWSPYLFFGFTLLGVIYSAYLTYLEFAVINAVCPFCVISAVIMLFLFILSLIQIFRTPLEGIAT